MSEIIQITKENIDQEHICCAFSDKKAVKGYQLKKEWLKKEFDKSFVFYRLDERAKVFIEYCDIEDAWAPVNGENMLFINCFWVSGKYKGNGYGKQLLEMTKKDALKKGKDGICTVVGTKKMLFMSDTKWLLRQDFVEVQKLDHGLSLLTLKLNDKASNPVFTDTAVDGSYKSDKDVTVFYTNRCPFTEYYINQVLSETLEKRKLSYEYIKFESHKQAQESPAPSSIFSLFYKGKFITTDISICLEKKFDKLIGKA